MSEEPDLAEQEAANNLKRKMLEFKARSVEHVRYRALGVVHGDLYKEIYLRTMQTKIGVLGESLWGAVWQPFLRQCKSSVNESQALPTILFDMCQKFLADARRRSLHLTNWKQNEALLEGKELFL